MAGRREAALRELAREIDGRHALLRNHAAYLGTTMDVANAALWLAGEDCFMTGQVLQVNGDLTLRRNPAPDEISASRRAHALPGSPRG